MQESEGGAQQADSEAGPESAEVEGGLDTVNCGGSQVGKSRADSLS